MIENLKNSHKVSLTIFQSQRRMLLAGANVVGQTGVVGVREVAPSKRHWVTESSLPVNMEV